MTTADDSGRPPRTRKARTLTELIEGYPSAWRHEVSGIFHEVAGMPGHPPDYTRIITFLAQVGREHGELFEPNSFFREEARRVLLRQVAMKLLREQQVLSGERRAVVDCVAFFAEHEEHCKFKSRDRKELFEFLERAWKLNQTPRFRDLIPLDVMVTALVNAGHYMLLMSEHLTIAVGRLYGKLREQVPRQIRSRTGEHPEDVDPCDILLEETGVLIGHVISDHKGPRFELARALFVLRTLAEELRSREDEKGEDE